MVQEPETKTEQPKPSIGEIIADLYRQIRQPYRWDQVRALMPLFFIRLAAVIAYILSVLGLMTADISGAADWFLNGASAVCLFFLSATYTGYRPAAIAMTVSLAISLLSAHMGSVPLLTVMAGLCGFTSNFFEYSANSHVASKHSGRLADCWNRLFLWTFGAIFVGAFAFFVTLMLSYVFDSMGLLILIVTYVPDLIVDMLYLTYLGRTIYLVKTQKML